MADEVPKHKGPTASSVLVTCIPPGNPQRASVRIYRDEAKRVSTCQICEGPINKGVRLILVFRLPKAYAFPSGGIMWEKKTFAHPECLIRDSGIGDIWEMIHEQHKTGKRMPFYRLCWDCRKPVLTLNGNRKENRVYIGKNRQYAQLCELCVKKKWWSKCHRCASWFQTSRTKRAWFMTGDQLVEVMACEGCVAGGHLLTAREVRKIEQYQADLELQFWKLNERLKEEHAPRTGD